MSNFHNIAPGLMPTVGADEEAYWRSIGGHICLGGPNQPAVLLVHGLGERDCWTSPSTVGFAYDKNHDPGRSRVGDTHGGPGVGIEKIAGSRMLYGDDADSWNNDNSWFTFLKRLRFTVATFQQPEGTFDDAYPTTKAALERFLQWTYTINPSAPPPIALIGHSRGGLLIRKLLKDMAGEAQGRVKWVVTLHSPHQGSDWGRLTAEAFADAIDLFIGSQAPALIPNLIKSHLHDLLVELFRPLNKFVGRNVRLLGRAAQELTPDSPLLRSIASGESALPGARYYSFGGVDVSLVRLYAFMFDAMSAVPQYKAHVSLHGGNVQQYFVWHSESNEIAPMSPALDKMPALVQEMRKGVGDGVVTDQSARLPFSSALHVSQPLNHFEVLWNQTLMGQVAGLFT